MRDYETVVPESQFLALAKGRPGDFDAFKVRPVDQDDDADSYILSKFRITTMEICTTTVPVGLYNYAIVVLRKTDPAPQASVYRYSLRQIAASRKYSKEIGIKFTTESAYVAGN